MILQTLIASLVAVQVVSFGGFGCQNSFSPAACNEKNSCRWCDSIDGDDHLCFNKRSIPKLPKGQWNCSQSTKPTLATEIPFPTSSTEILVPTSSFFGVYQQSNEKHCVELLCDSEQSYNR